jgi:hypothetical protein
MWTLLEAYLEGIKNKNLKVDVCYWWEGGG